MDRCIRRFRTQVIIRRRCETPFFTPRREPHHYAKISPLGCGCRKRTHGRPKVGKGLCEIGSRDRVYRWRAQARELRNLARSWQGDWDADEVSLVTDPQLGRY